MYILRLGIVLSRRFMIPLCAGDFCWLYVVALQIRFVTARYTPGRQLRRALQVTHPVQLASLHLFAFSVVCDISHI